jgi:hypothetical protein
MPSGGVHPITAATAVALANTESHDLGLRLAWGLIASSTPTP